MLMQAMYCGATSPPIRVFPRREVIGKRVHPWQIMAPSVSVFACPRRSDFSLPPQGFDFPVSSLLSCSVVSDLLYLSAPSPPVSLASLSTAPIYSVEYAERPRGLF